MGNTINKNNCGIYIFSLIGIDLGNDNIIYFNNFINNHDNLFSYNSPNIWNTPAKVIYTYKGNNYTSYLGNYWDNYTGNDANNDGIGDTPFIINGEVDNYPLMEPIENYEIIKILEPLEVSGERISGYNLFFLIGIIPLVITILISKRRKKY